MPKETLLIVDDEKEIIDLLEIYLKNEGYQTLRAYNGMEAIEILQKHHVDLIILDIMMPRMDGIQACLQIREQKNMPIIMLSAKSQDMDKIMGLSTGADDYVTKPFRLEQEYRFNQYKMMLVDSDGKVIYKSKNAITAQVDLFSLLRSAMEERTINNNTRKEFTSLYPILFQQKNAYVVVSGIPQPIISYSKGQSPLSLVIALAAFIFLFYFMTQRKMRYIEELA